MSAFKKPANFKEDFNKGQLAENKFAADWNMEIIDRKNCPDMRSPTGTLLELKSDFFDMAKTPNYFMERYSYDIKDGGPWAAKNAGSEIFCYQFVQNAVQFFFRTDELVAWLEANVNTKNLISIMNVRHVTRGYKINREDVVHLLLSVEQLEAYGIKKV